MTTQPKITLPKDLPPHLVLFRMLGGYRISEAIYVAAKLGLADLLGDGSRSSAELAKATGTHAPSLYRFMRLLASLGVFAEQEDGRFALTPVGACLRTGVPGSIHPAVLFLSGPTPFHRMWSDLLYSVQTGEPAFGHLFGAGPFEYLAQHPEGASGTSGFRFGPFNQAQGPNRNALTGRTKRKHPQLAAGAGCNGRDRSLFIWRDRCQRKPDGASV